MPNPARVPVAALRLSHDRLAGLVAGLAPDDVRRMSYASEWTIAQVLSHLGSGAEIGQRWLSAALAHGEPIGPDEMNPIWDMWNKRDPRDQVTEAIKADERLVAAYEALSDDELAAAHLDLFGGAVSVDGSGLAMFRLPEHAVHTWDVAVALDRTARVASYAVDLLIDELGSRIGWTAKPQDDPWSVVVRTADPGRTFLLANTADAVSLTATDTAAEAADGVLRLPAEALLRLVFGRLDEANADGVDLSGTTVTLAQLRTVFQGF
jgi:uncharacterized protein (TIGR03083 family)